MEREYKSNLEFNAKDLFNALNHQATRADLARLKNDLVDRMDMKFDAMDVKFNAMDIKFNALNSKMDTTFNALDSKIDTTFNAMDTKFEALNSKFNLMVVLIVAIGIPSISASIKVLFF